MLGGDPTLGVPVVCDVDWTATGTMLTGVGTIMSALAIFIAALIGSSRFNEWKRQKQEERRMDAAERILTLAYELRYDLQSARSPMTQGHELDAAERKLAADPETRWESKTDEEKQRFKLAQSALTRLHNFNDQWQQIWTLKPVALAFFGQDVEQNLHAFWTQYIAVRLAAEAYATDNGRDPDFSQRIRRDLWRVNDENDRVEAEVNRAVQALEAELLPVLRSGPVAPRPD